MAKVLAVKRISLDTESSSALYRQGQELQADAEAHGDTIVGWVEDRTVSGSVNLDDRPSLGEWLREPKLHEWDVMTFTEQDRVTRDDTHWGYFVYRLLQWGKGLRVLDDPDLDLSTPDGRRRANDRAVAAANYRLSVQRKAKKAKNFSIEEKLWPGGNEPCGWMSEPVMGPDEKWHYRLVHDTVTGTADLLRSARDELFKGKFLAEIVRDWNARKLPTPKDAQRIRYNAQNRRKKKLAGTKWAVTTLSAILHSRHILGQQERDGKPVLDNGIPVQFGEPIITREDQQRIMEILKSRGGGTRGSRVNNSPLNGVLFCACGKLMYSNMKHGARRYRCATRTGKNPCNFSYEWRADFVHTMLDELFFSEIAHIEVVEKTFVPGDDRSGEIAELEEAIANLAGNLAAMPAGSASAAAVIGTMTRYEADLAALRAVPAVAAHWEEKPTGQSYGDLWREAEDWPKRGQLLRDCGVRLILTGSKETPVSSLVVPADLERRVKDAGAKTIEPGHLDSMAVVFEQVRAAFLGTRPAA